jgi:hypothetical protein
MQLYVVSGPLVGPTCQWEGAKSPPSSTALILSLPLHAAEAAPEQRLGGVSPLAPGADRLHLPRGRSNAQAWPLSSALWVGGITWPHSPHSSELPDRPGPTLPSCTHVPELAWRRRNDIRSSETILPSGSHQVVMVALLTRH